MTSSNTDVKSRKIEAGVLKLLPEFVKFAHKVADEARKPSLHYFRASPDLTIKTDGTPVTVGDQETERVIRELLTDRYPKHAIMGEEEGWTHSDQPYTWVIDPIDGTKSYLSGVPTYGMLLALLYEGIPIVGIVDIPALDERWCGVIGQFATSNDKFVSASSCSTLDQAILTIISPDKLNVEERSAVENLSRQVKVRQYSSDGYAHPLLASGFIDTVVAVGQQPFDYLSVVPVVEGAGGCITDWSGQPLGLESDGRILVSATPQLHKQALAALQQGLHQSD